MDLKYSIEYVGFTATLPYRIQCVGLRENLSHIAGGRNVINLTD